MQLRSVAAALWLLAAAAPPAAAHDTWVRPLDGRVAAGRPLTAELSAGHGLRPLDAPRRRRCSALRWVGAGGRRRARNWRTVGKCALAGFGSGAPAGLSCLALTTRATVIEIDADGVDGYLAEIQPPATLLQRWRAQRDAGVPWVEHYAKDAKGYLRAPGGSQPWWRLARLGQTLEIVPLADPTRLRKGRSLTVQLCGVGAADAALRIFGPRGSEQVVRSAGDGRATLPLQRAGAHLIAVTVLQPPACDGAPWTSRFATLSFTVRG